MKLARATCFSYQTGASRYCLDSCHYDGPKLWKKIPNKVFSSFDQNIEQPCNDLT